MFDGLIIPILLFKPTPYFGIIAPLLLSSFNAIVFQIGIFPFLSLGFLIFFIQPARVENLFKSKKPTNTKSKFQIQKINEIMYDRLSSNPNHSSNKTLVY